MPIVQGKKRRRANKLGAAATKGARLTLVRPRKKKKKSKSSPKPAAATRPPPVYLVVEHAAGERTHSVLELAAGAAPRRLLDGSRCMSFPAVATRHGPRIVGLGMHRTVVYDPKTSTEARAPFVVYPKMRPVLIPHGANLYALSRVPSIVRGIDFMPWFFVLDVDAAPDTWWRRLPPPPVFPCRVNPLEYRDRPEVRVSAYSVVGSHILLSVQREKGTGTCAFDVEAEEWEMVCDENLPFTGEAVHLGGHRFVARDKDGVAVVYHMEIRVVDTASTTEGGGRKMDQLAIFELPVVSKGIVPGQLLCAMGDGRFSSFDIRYDDPGAEAMLEKARIVHRTYSQVHGHDAENNSVVIIAKKERRIYKLRDPFGHLARPSPVVAAFTI